MIDRNIWVTPSLYEGKDFPEGPTPNDAKLFVGEEYLVLDYLEGEGWDGKSSVTLVNQEGEIWAISNRHLRVTKITDINGNILFQRDWAC